MKRAITLARSGFEAILGAILPLRPRAERTRGRSFDDFKPAPAQHDLLGTRITTLLEYQQPAVEDLIRSLKYDGSRHAAHVAATLLADYLQEEIASVKTFSSRPVILIPLPLHGSRLRERGFNQIELVLDALPEEFKNGEISRIEKHALCRERATTPQTHFSRSERLSNVAGAFTIRDPALVEGAHVFLIDDVTTTGATLVNAATPLRRAGAEVTLLALARA